MNEKDKIYRIIYWKEGKEYKIQVERITKNNKIYGKVYAGALDFIKSLEKKYNIVAEKI